jgi:hypothetical protein
MEWVENQYVHERTDEEISSLKCIDNVTKKMGWIEHGERRLNDVGREYSNNVAFIYWKERSFKIFGFLGIF